MEYKVGDKIPVKRFNYSDKDALEALKNIENYDLVESPQDQQLTNKYKRLFTNSEGVIVKIEEVDRSEP